MEASIDFCVSADHHRGTLLKNCATSVGLCQKKKITADQSAALSDDFITVLVRLGFCPGFSCGSNAIILPANIRQIVWVCIVSFSGNTTLYPVKFTTGSANAADTVFWPSRLVLTSWCVRPPIMSQYSCLFKTRATPFYECMVQSCSPSQQVVLKPQSKRLQESLPCGPGIVIPADPWRQTHRIDLLPDVNV